MQKADLCQRDIVKHKPSLKVYQKTDTQLIRTHIRPYRVAQEEERSVIHYSGDVLLQTRQQYEDYRQQHTIYLIHSTQELEQTVFIDFRMNYIYHLAGGDGIHTTQDIDKLYDAGFRSIQPVRQFSNHLASSHTTSAGGLSDIGKDLITYMQHKGIVIDVAGMNSQSMIDVYTYTKKPILHSHTNIARLCSYSMNVTDEFLDYIDQSNGLLGLAWESIGMTGSRETSATRAQYVQHIQYVRDRIGDDNLAFSSGFFPLFATQFVEQKNSIDDMTWIVDQMVSGFGHKFAEKFFWGNMYRFLIQTL